MAVILHMYVHGKCTSVCFAHCHLAFLLMFRPPKNLVSNPDDKDHGTLVSLYTSDHSGGLKVSNQFLLPVTEYRAQLVFFTQTGHYERQANNDSSLVTCVCIITQRTNLVIHLCYGNYMCRMICHTRSLCAVE